MEEWWPWTKENGLPHEVEHGSQLTASKEMGSHCYNQMNKTLPTTQISKKTALSLELPERNTALPTP